MAKKKNVKKFNIDWRFILFLQAIASAALFLSVMKLGALPTLYLGLVGVVLVALCGIFALLIKPSKKKKQPIGKLFAKVVSVLVSIVLLVGCLYIERGYSALENIVGANKQITRYSVIVLADDSAEDLEDLGSTVIEYCKLNDKPEHLNEVMNQLEADGPSISTETVADYKTLADRLYDGEVDAILMNEAYKGLLEDSHPAFESETKVIWHYDIEEELSDFVKEADVTNETFNIYVSGIDTTGPISTVSRSDVNMLITVNPVSKQILLTSIPRDYFVPLANYGIEDKLTHSGLGGIENTVKTVENFLDIDINYYVRVNFTSLETIVDALGGITVNSPYAFTTLHGGYWINQGENEMDGYKALCFVRERYALPNGDNDRVQNQQLVIKAMLQKAMSPAIITNYTNILNAVEGAFETNMSSNEIMKLIRMQLDDMSSWTFSSSALKGYGAMLTGGAYFPYEELYYMVPYEDSIAECSGLIKQMTFTGE